MRFLAKSIEKMKGTSRRKYLDEEYLLDYYDLDYEDFEETNDFLAEHLDLSTTSICYYGSDPDSVIIGPAVLEVSGTNMHDSTTIEHLSQAKLDVISAIERFRAKYVNTWAGDPPVNKFVDEWLRRISVHHVLICE
jgi:hypothetical protein